MPRPRKSNLAELSKETYATTDPIPTPPAVHVAAVEPVLRTEKLYRLVREGMIGNLRVEELTLVGNEITGRRYVSERDARPFAMSRLLGLIEDELQRRPR